MKKLFFILLIFFIYHPIAIADTTSIYSSSANDTRTTATPGASWATVRSSSHGTLYLTETESDRIVGANLYLGEYYITRAYIEFDTSSIPGTVTAAVLYIYGYSDDDDTVIAQQGTQSTPPTTEEFDHFSGVYFGESGAWSTSGYNAITFNPTGIAAINTSGATKLVLRNKSKDYDNVAPTTSAWNGGYFADYTGTDHDPYLYITYTPDTFSISGTLKTIEGGSGAAINYIITETSDGSVFAYGTSAGDGTYSETTPDGTTEYDVSIISTTYGIVNIADRVVGKVD